MPVYAVRCHCGHCEDFYAPVDERNNVPEHCGKPMNRLISKPYVIEDMKPYISPVDGKPITSRKAHKDQLAKHGLIEIGNEKLSRPATRKADLPPVEQDLHKAMTEAGL